jgi:SAM-dependent methyltransferase
MRRLVPSMPVLARNRFLVPFLALPDRLAAAIYPEFRRLPPNRFRIRVGVGNRLIFNQARFLEGGYRVASRMFALGLAGTNSRITDVGSGCGSLALALSGINFSGRYVGLDVDREMIDWCNEHLSDARYGFVHANVYSKVYNPAGSREPYTLPLEDSSQDLVVSQSLFSHLLEAELNRYMEESFRVLDKGGQMAMTVHCLEDMRARGELGGRWTFAHRIGPAHVENPRYPEAVVAYERDYILGRAKETGFNSAEMLSYPMQNLLVARK